MKFAGPSTNLTFIQNLHEVTLKYFYMVEKVILLL